MVCTNLQHEAALIISEYWRVQALVFIGKKNRTHVVCFNEDLPKTGLGDE